MGHFTSKITVLRVYHCTLERAFKTPMLCDVSKIHTGFGIMPAVTHTTDDENWGQIGSTKKVYAAKSLTQSGGFASVDTVLERKENVSWKIEVSNFQAWMLSFTRFTGEWNTESIGDEKILITYIYTMHSSNAFLYPLNWLFTKFFWKTYMKRVLDNIETLIANQEPYLFE